ncbi:MAB_1171c family putative transporter [Kitasatospora sp. NPDC052896]|uniref:MAB_1171c family putative transporter n=1 Tax=Kitasatospora sp. NPDC052896 TaxID=3364061 RepID=UPI0037C9F72E
MTILVALPGVAILAALTWKLYQLVKAPQDSPLRAVTLCLASVGAAFPLGLQSAARAFDSLAGHGSAKLLQNALLLGAAYWLMCFYLYSASDHRQGRIRARWEAVPLVIAIATISLAALTTPQSVKDRLYATTDMRVTQVAVFYLVAGLYLVYAMASALRWTWRYARMSTRPLAAGLWMAAAGMAGLVAASSVRAVFVVIRWWGGSVPVALLRSADLLLVIGVPLFMIGVSYPGFVTRVAAIRIWRHHRRLYRRLYPLWTMLHEAYPEDALNRVPVSRWDYVLSLRSVHHRYYRRVIECRDGLVRISPYLADLCAYGDGDGETSPVALAEHLRTALETYLSGGSATSTAVPIALPRSDDLDADVRQLVALADAVGPG